MSTILGAGQYIGAANVALTEADYDAIRDLDPGLYRVGLDRKLRNAYFFMLPLNRNAATSAGVEGFSPVYTAQFPFRVVGVAACVEASAGTAAVVDLDKALAADPTTFATMLSGTINVHGTAGANIGTFVNGTLLEATKDVAYGDKLRLGVLSTGDVATGTHAHLYCVRL